jgi:hypothetical protein
MNTRFFLALLALLAPLALAAPPAQSDLTRKQLARMKPDERATLEQRLGVGLYGLGNSGTLLAGARSDVETFDGKVVVIVRWSVKDAASARAIETLHQDLGELEGVLVIALHPPKELGVLQRIYNRKPFPGPIVLDDTDAFVTPLAIDVRGGNIIIDKVGAIRYAGINPAAVRPLVEALLEESPRDITIPELTLDALAEQLETGKQLDDQIAQAWQTGDTSGAETLLDQLWQDAPAAALPMTMNLLTARDPVQRPLAVSLLSKYGTQQNILTAINSLEPRRQSPEITILVRALGSEDLENPELVLAPFLDSRDLDVRQAALYALADSASPEVIDDFVRALNKSPVASDSWSTSDRDRLLNSQFGAAYKLTGLRANTGLDYANWLDVYRTDPQRAAEMARLSITDASGNPQSIRFSSDIFQAFSMFDLAARIEATGNQLPDPEIPMRLENAARAADRQAEPILGKVYVSPVRVYLADARGFASLASNSYMGGQTRVNRIYLRFVGGSQLEGLMTHEWAHVLHTATFDKTPRWLAEGFAESVSTTSHRLDLPTLRHRGVDKAVEKGLFSQLLSWQSGASSDSREANRYNEAKTGVDFLRFGPFTAGDTRLNLLLAHISRGRGERDALEMVYGMKIRDLDQAVRDWVSRPE